MIKNIFFDLDGTLLPMDTEFFTTSYFKLLVKKAMPLGYEGKELIEALWLGVEAMVRNDNSKSNDLAFWESFAKYYHKENVDAERAFFEEFYKNEFQQAIAFCNPGEDSAKIVELCKEKGLRTILATNPIFPEIATLSRIRWAGLKPEDFEYITVYENCGYAKPNLKYYSDLLEKTGCLAGETLMVGNDVDEDLIAEKLGMEVFLLTDYAINKHNKDVSKVKQGGFKELAAFIQAL